VVFGNQQLEQLEQLSVGLEFMPDCSTDNTTYCTSFGPFANSTGVKASGK
jgi:hypothetical protein